MNSWLIAGMLENMSPRQWFVYGAMLLTVACALHRTAGNLIEMCRLRRAGYYAVRVWGASSGLVQIFLVAECLIVGAISVLLLLLLLLVLVLVLVLVLSDVTLW